MPWNSDHFQLTTKYPNGETANFTAAEFDQIVDLFKLLIKWDMELKVLRSSLLTVLSIHKVKLELELEKQILLRKIKEFNKPQKVPKKGDKVQVGHGLIR